MKRKKIILILSIVIIISCILIIYYFISLKNKQKLYNQNNQSDILDDKKIKNVDDFNSKNNNQENINSNDDGILIETSQNKNKKNPEDSLWRIEIPKIDLVAKIEDGVSKEVLRESVGHFQNSSVVDGNVCLAAHNRGYLYNYFERLNELQVNDTIKYFYKGILIEYNVQKIKVVSENDLSDLVSNKDNLLTLYTCIKNQPESRLCVISSMK